GQDLGFARRPGTGCEDQAGDDQQRKEMNAHGSSRRSGRKIPVLLLRNPTVLTGRASEDTPGIIARTVRKPGGDPMSDHTIPGIHHVTAIAGEPQRNLDFYTQMLGLRLVKLTVNFDDPGTYHFYFGDAKGTPGSILTFFPWAGVPRGRVGTGQVAATSFAVPAGSLDYWRDRLAAYEIANAGERFGEAVLRLEDPDGLPLEIIATENAPSGSAWKGGSIDPAHAIAGFHSATLL